MFSTTVLATAFIGLLITSMLLWGFFLKLGLRWAKVPTTTRHIVTATTAVFILQVVLNVLLVFVAPNLKHSGSLWFAQLVLAAAVPCTVIVTIFRISFGQAIQAWLPTLVVSIAITAVTLLVFRPFVFEAFSMPTNAMAPTMLGNHWLGKCPECGQANYGLVVDERYAPLSHQPVICDNFHITETAPSNKTAYNGDRFFVAKFLAPRRWDIIVFEYPSDPPALYAMRLVGLPGEEVYIDQGAVWIDGKRQTTPESIRGLRYLTEIPGAYPGDSSASVEHPAVLGPDEFFVLGDFTAVANDSRMWWHGAEGHNRYAVPKSNVKGVVTHTYWPPSRWRIHR